MYIYIYIYIYLFILIKLFFALFFLQLSSIAFVGVLGNTGQAENVQPAGDVQPLVWLDGCTSAALKPI